MQILILPNQLLNPIFVKGLRQPLEDIAEILDKQGKTEHALSCRDAANVCEAFSKVCLEKTAKIVYTE